MDIEVARLELRQAKNERLWDLSLDASVSRGGEQRRDYAVGLGLNIPLGDRSSELAELGARNGLRDAEVGLVELRQSIRIEVRQAVHEVAVGFRRIELARTSRELAEQTLDIEQAKLAQGLTSTFRLTSVEDDLVSAQNGELDATIGYRNALTSLDRILGTTLESWGIEVEGEASEAGRAQDERAAQALGVQSERGLLAASHREETGTAFEPSRRVLDTVHRMLASTAPGSAQGTRAAPTEKMRRSLLLSLREFEHGQAATVGLKASREDNDADKLPANALMLRAQVRF